METIASGYGLIEGPVWDKLNGLYFSDVINGGVFRLDRAGKIMPVVPRRRGIGGMALHEAGGLVVGGRDIACVSLKDGASKTLLALDAIPGATGFNDLTTDAAGRIYVGSLAYKVFGGDPPKPGHLHVIDLDGGMRTISDGVMLTNGLGFSPDGCVLYHCDTAVNGVWAHDYADDGSAAGRRFLVRRDDLSPDGLAVDEAGTVWVADVSGSGSVRAFAPTGKEVARIEVPARAVTSLCFGGVERRHVYIVTADNRDQEDRAGTVFYTRAEVPGCRIPLARV